jgi:lipopolysaccharide/colanic/teichoic acid biosynthesis glycosyltransferase
MELRRLSGLLSRTGARPGAYETLLTQPQFQSAVRRERSRADRCASGFSLLTLSATQRGASEAAAGIAQVLDGRVRESDIAGWFAGDVIGVILPDTAAAGAWKLAEDLHSAFEQRQVTAKFQVYVYPSIDASESGSLAETDAAERETAPADRPVQSLEMLFVQKLPMWKRTIDVVGATAGLLAAFPVMLLAALAIKLTSPGPIFFAQRRDGLGGRNFWIYKFRTMVINADAVKAELRHRSEQDGPAFKLKDDPRVTRVGRLLRRTCIDELPQLWNVLRGDMSIVGPRPMCSQEARHCAAWERRRLEVTPGLTCIWQVHGGTKVTFTEWMRMDRRYVKSRTLLKDLRLMILTVPSVIRRDGVY